MLLFAFMLQHCLWN